MDERRWERLGATYGVAFAVLLLVSLFLAPVPPHIDASIGKITSYYEAHRDRIITAQMLGGFAVLAFLLFVGHLRHVLARSERGAEAAAPVVLMGGVALGVTALIGQVPAMVLAVMAGQGTVSDGGMVRALYDLTYLVGGPIGLVAALFVGAVGYAMVKGEIGEAWLGYAGLANAALFLVVGVADFYLGSYEATWLALNFIAVAVFAVWNLAAGTVMLMRPEAARAALRRSILAPTAG